MLYRVRQVYHTPTKYDKYRTKYDCIDTTHVLKLVHTATQ